MVGDEKVVVTHKPFGPRQAPASSQAAIAQLGERQTEDLKVPSSILGLGIFMLVGTLTSTFVRTEPAVFPRFMLLRNISVYCMPRNVHLWQDELVRFTLIS